MEPFQLFEFCPRCGRRRDGPVTTPFRCTGCGLVLYFNPAVAVGVILLGPDGRALFVRRAKDPAQGKLGLPGGFVDFGETAEDAVRREVREEVNLEVAGLEFLCSAVNRYAFAGVTYPVLDLFFVARAESVSQASAQDEVASLCWLAPAEVDLEEIAFPSMRQALRLFNTRCSG
jgi:ADP-ribose pyrophosphatase YjhB (NUDIX family)